MRRAVGSSLIELIVLLGVTAAVVTAVAPEWVSWRQSYRLQAATRHVALTIAAVQTRAAVEGVGYGLRFRGTATSAYWELIRDGDGDGIRAGDVRSGVDAVLRDVAIADGFPGIGVGAPGTASSLSGGVAPADGIAFGVSDTLSIRPEGSTTSGTLYLYNGLGEGGAVRIYGPTGRVSIWRFGAERGSWQQR
ncbi:MAG: hypothetical protein GKS06_07045 [Acidobacteria bacterium]|nr:hypothetical protein [Acidobacteriota bacterium]